jgi:hypothetical protein
MEKNEWLAILLCCIALCVTHASTSRHDCSNTSTSPRHQWFQSQHRPSKGKHFSLCRESDSPAVQSIQYSQHGVAVPTVGSNKWK